MYFGNSSCEVLVEICKDCSEEFCSNCREEHCKICEKSGDECEFCNIDEELNCTDCLEDNIVHLLNCEKCTAISDQCGNCQDNLKCDYR